MQRNLSEKPRLGIHTSIASPEAINEYNSREGIILRFWLQECAATLLAGERVRTCMRFIAPHKNNVEVLKVAGGKRATYRNLAVCGSIWHCPVCAARISEKRKHDLHKALAVWDGSVIMLTYTMSHTGLIPLETVLERLLEAYRMTKSGKGFQEVKEHYLWAGSVRALEVTHGRFGWHAHIHELVFVEKHGRTPEENRLTDVQVGQLQFTLSKRWRAMLEKKGGSAHARYGLDVRTADSEIAKYVAKYGREPLQGRWDVGHEITKQVVKKGAQGENRTPMQILYDYGEGDELSGRIWKTYAMAFKGRNQLVWSKGLRERLKLGIEQSDLEIAEETPPEFSPFATISERQWRAIRECNARAKVLRAAVLMDKPEFDAFVEEIASDYEEWEANRQFAKPNWNA